MTFRILQYRIGTNFRAHKRLITALGTIATRKKFGHLPVSQKARGNTVAKRPKGVISGVLQWH